MHSPNRLAIVLAAALLAAPAAAQDLIIYPAQGQSQAQQDRDRSECHSWAVQQSGFDPSRPQAAQTAPATGPDGSMVRGAARGAAVGAVGGAIAGSAGTGAAAGAAMGGLIGGMRRADQSRQAQADAQQQSAAAAQGRSAYNRAMAACLQARGYTVN